LDPDGEVIERLEGFKPAASLAQSLYLAIDKDTTSRAGNAEPRKQNQGQS
jgi:hypothetical protein